MSYQLDVSTDLHALANNVRTFVNDVVMPAEVHLDGEAHGVPDALRGQLQQAARHAGVFAPTAPTEWGGLGLDHRGISIILEESGRSLLGPAAMNCAAPDEGNILLLDKVATFDQKARYLGPLCRGEIRSAFAMTEPSPGAGSDPQLLQTRAERTDTGWVINGQKWFITGADGAAFTIVMARTGDEATMFLVDASNPGMRVERTLNTLDRAFSGGHCVVVFDDCHVGDDAILGTPNEGFQNAQVRLSPARLTHCMRWLGAARRAHETAVSYASARPMFGTTLGSLGMAQQLIADNEIDIAASRGLIREAAWALDQHRPGRKESSIAKTFVGEAVFRIVDRSMQLSGARGVSDESPIARIFTEIRAFRIYDGPSEVHRWAIARRSLRLLEAGRLPGDWMP